MNRIPYFILPPAYSTCRLPPPPPPPPPPPLPAPSPPPQAVNQLLAHFAGYTGIKKIETLREHIGEIRDALRTQVFEDFNHLSAQVK